jgi:hypothetical protein
MEQPIRIIRPNSKGFFSAPPPPPETEEEELLYDALATADEYSGVNTRTSTGGVGGRAAKVYNGLTFLNLDKQPKASHDPYYTSEFSFAVNGNVPKPAPRRSSRLPFAPSSPLSPNAYDAYQRTSIVSSFGANIYMKRSSIAKPAIVTKFPSPPVLDELSENSPIGTINPDDIYDEGKDDRETDRMIADMLKRLDMKNDDIDFSPLFKGPLEPKARQIEVTSKRETHQDRQINRESTRAGAARHIDPLQRFLLEDATKPHARSNSRYQCAQIESDFMNHELCLDDPIAEEADHVMDLPRPRARFEDKHENRRRASAAPSRPDNSSRRTSQAPIQTSGEARRKIVAPARHSSIGMNQQIDQLRRRESVDPRLAPRRPTRSSETRLKIMVMPKKSVEKVVMLRLNVPRDIDIRSMNKRVKGKCESSGEGWLCQGQRLYWFNGSEPVRLTDEREWWRLKEMAGDRIVRLLIQ